MEKYDLLDKLMPRYMRSIVADPVAAVEPTMRSQVHKVNWLPHFYAYPGVMLWNGDGDESSSSSGSRKRDFLEDITSYFRMDASSGLAVSCLKIDCSMKKLKVLDLCCCPGAKFQMIASNLSDDSLLVGVDYNDKRIDTCKSLMLKSLQVHLEKNQCVDIPRQIIFHCDGTTFCSSSFGTLRFDSKASWNEIKHRGKRQKKNKSSQKREKDYLKQVEKFMVEGQRGGQNKSNASEPEDKDKNKDNTDSSHKDSISSNCLDYFDFVLVDAECTHDESYRHMKFIRPPIISTTEPEQGEMKSVLDVLDVLEGLDTHALTSGPVLKPYANLSHTHSSSSNGSGSSCHSSTDELAQLQRGLLANGFSLLRPGGTMVYSTCSNQQAQNEDIVQWLLEYKPDAVLECIDFNRDNGPCNHASADDGSGRVSGVSGSCSSSSSSGSSSSGSRNSGRSSSALELLKTAVSLDELSRQLGAHTVEQIGEISAALCAEVARLHAPIYTSGSLPGTVRLNFRGGLSGHFIAKIRKEDI